MTPVVQVDMSKCFGGTCCLLFQCTRDRQQAYPKRFYNYLRECTASHVRAQ